MAAKLSKYPLRGTNSQELVFHVGKFVPDTNSAAHAITVDNKNQGGQFTVRKTGAGVYVVTFTDSYTVCVYRNACISGSSGVLPSGASGNALAVAISNFTNNTLTLTTYNPATALSSSAITAVDPSSVPASSEINFMAVFRATTVPM